MNDQNVKDDSRSEIDGKRSETRDTEPLRCAFQVWATIWGTLAKVLEFFGAWFHNYSLSLCSPTTNEEIEAKEVKCPIQVPAHG